MRLFTCPCGQVVYFENVRCTQCGHTLAFLPDMGRVGAITLVAGSDPALFEAVGGAADGQQYRMCANRTDYEVCNWAVPVSDPLLLCESCRLNEVIPDLARPENRLAWKKLELAKRRLYYSLRALGLPIESRAELPGGGLRFSFMEDTSDGTRVFTGHSDGAITINIAEADDPFRENLRKQLGEVYRTVLGHFRHEIGHYYWDRLVRDTLWHEPFRARFGDERVSYADALATFYASPGSGEPPLHCVSSYAASHPWEDWAETWAHYMHMVDTLETARGYGLALRPEPVDGQARTTLATRSIDFDDFDDLLRGWVPLTLALNSLNRSMGLSDHYPFALTHDAIDKLRFVHDVIESSHATPEVQQELAARWTQRLVPPA